MSAQPQNTNPSSAPKAKRRRVGLSFYAEERLKASLRESAPSEPWVEAQFKTADDVDQEGAAIVYRYHDPHVFPPGGKQTLMRRCPECGVFMPPNSFEHGRCLDHADHRGWGPSPSAVAIAALQLFNLRTEEMPLDAEDRKSLWHEIRAFERARKRKVGRRAKSRKSRNDKSQDRAM